MSRYKRTLLDVGVPYDGDEQAVKRKALSSGSSYSRSPVSLYQDPSSDTRETSDGNDGLSDNLDVRDSPGSSLSPLTPLSITSPVHCETSLIKSGASRKIVHRPEICFGMVSSSVDVS